MSTVKVLNQNGEQIGDYKLNDAVFAVETNNQVMFDAIQVALSNARQDTSKTKVRSEVSGGGKKPWKQKGTGRARQGSTRSPQWRHGGTVFGPTGLQNHSIKQNKKERTLALKSVLTEKVQENSLIVIDQFKFAEPKTKEMIKCLDTVGAKGKTLIVVDYESFNENAILSAFNIPTVYFLYADQINVYDVMNADTLICTKEAITSIEEVILNA